MKISIDKSFEKDTKLIDDKAIKKSILNCILNVQSADSLTEINNLKKLKGFRNKYRIKISNLRLGLTIEDGSVFFIRCLHRKDIYRYFPK